MAETLDVCILGDGMTGCALALTLAAQGWKTGLVATSGPADAVTATATTTSATDVRAFSLNATARKLLLGLEAWPDVSQTCAVQRIAVWGDRGGQIEFQAGAEPALSWIVEARGLLAVLRERVGNCRPHIELLNHPQAATLTAVCEGRSSASRRALGIESDGLHYDQYALACRVRHEQPHQSCARQWFSGHGNRASILALLPLADAHHSALVWSQPARLAQARKALSAAELAQEITLESRSVLGQIVVQSESSIWPLQHALARQWTGVGPDGGAFVLLGDAAHQVHPLAGLGLNLGLADVATLGKLLQPDHHVAQGSRVGQRRVLRQYERQRKFDVGTVQAVCDGLQALFAHPSGGARWLRNTGLSCVNRVDFLKQWLVMQATHLERVI